MPRRLKAIGAYEILVGLLGLVMGFLAIPNYTADGAIGAFPLFELLVLSLSSILAGAFLAMGTDTGFALSRVVQAVQVPVVSLPPFICSLHLGIYLNPLKLLDSGLEALSSHVGFDGGLGSQAFLTVSDLVDEQWVGVNLAAAALLFLLIAYRPRPNNSSKPTPLRGAA